MPPRRITTTRSLGQAFRDERKRRGWTQTDLASKSAIPQATISEFERGVGNPTAATILTLAAALRLEVLVGREEPTGPSFPWEREQS